MRNTILWPLVAIALTECAGTAQAAEYTTRDAGEVVSVEHVEASFATWAQMRVTTEKGVFVVHGVTSVYFGDAVTIRTHASGRKELCFASAPDECRGMRR